MARKTRDAVRLLSLLGSLTVLGYASFATPTSSTKKPLRFGRDVRPILSEHCFKCHGPDVGTAAAGLRFDTFEHAAKKLSDGAAIVPGNPSASLLLNRVSEKDPEMRMPPPGAGTSALTPEQIQILKEWIASGAKYEKHWSFVPPQMPAIPSVSDPKWVRNPVDSFVMAKLDEAGLKPEQEADKNTLAMRASQTLTGLPPTPEELDAYRKDDKPGAYERYVDRLLAKPEYGEHEARYWLDAVRYGDTHGLQLDNERSIYPYRDWVIRAFNGDLPYDKFVKWQVAGDLLPKPTTEQLIATGYVRCNLTSNEGGAIPEEFLARNTFDRVDTTSTVLLGLTVGCAKCHDHKYDPIKQRDYYGLYAYFDSTQDEPLDGNIALPPPFIRATTHDDEKRLASMNARMERLKEKVDPARAAEWLAQSQPPLPTSRDWQISPVYSEASFDAAFDKPEPGEPGQPDAAWKPFKFELGKDFPNLIGKDNSSVYVRGVVHYAKAGAVTLRVASDDGIRIWLNGKLIHSHKIGRGIDQGIDEVKAEVRAGDNELVAKLVNGVSVDGLDIHVGSKEAETADRALTGYRQSPTDPGAISSLKEIFLASSASEDANEFRRIRFAKEKFEAAIPMTLIAREMDTPRPTFILKRGQYDQPGDAVQRHIPPVLGQLPVDAPNDRLGLADWLTAPSNPLVARVFVNRLWQQHFGTGIVKTVEDFGSQGEWPENQPLLDYLAVTFQKDGWSVKKLNRLIVTSAAFRQSSRITPAKLAKDPENRLISRGPRFRLDAEVIRDKALMDGGLLVERIGGRGFKPYQPDGLWESSSDPASGTHFYVRDHGGSIYRRSMYLFWKRTSPPPVMITLDAPLRDTCIVRRSTTNTPLQALAVLNETAFLEASRTMAARVLKKPGDDEQRLKRLYNLTLGRAPKPFEKSLLEKALTRYRTQYDQDPKAAEKLLKVGDSPQSKSIPPAEQASWMIVCSSLMNTDEFLTQH
ncbi:MAG TPA: DUF1553 domain-containing protein [Fimbriimonas sp.]|nr:DUF1553 domain-containing protein [Fimbriimonas sp.]